MKGLATEIIAGLIAGVVFLAFQVFVKSGLWLSIGAAMATYLGVYLLIRPKPQVIYVEQTHLTQGQIDQLIREGHKKVDGIRKNSQAISNQHVQHKIDRICQVADDIFLDFKKDPKDIKAGRKFLNYYLDATDKVVHLYADLSKKVAHSSSERQTLDKAETILDQIERTFHKQLGKLQADDYMDLDTELSVLEMTMKSEGIE